MIISHTLPRACTLLLLTLFCALPTGSHAQDNPHFSIENDDSIEPIVSDFQHYYEEVTRATLSKLYWRLNNELDVHNNEQIDNYLRLNECEIYKQYFFDEFQWSKIRDRARSYLEKNSNAFSTRYKFEQPLRLSEYDIGAGVFEIVPQYQLNSITKYEVVATDAAEKICGEFQLEVKNYPSGMIVTLSQPFSLRYIPMSTERAKKYINQKNEQFVELNLRDKSKENLYKYRDAYLIMKIRFFDYRGEEFADFGNYNAALVNAVLEGYEIYSDRAHTDLLYYKNFLRKDQNVSNKERLKDQYEEMIRRRQKADKELEERYGTTK